MNNLEINKRIIIVLCGIIILFSLIRYSDCQIDSKNSFNDDFKIWLEWKCKQNLPPYQRNVINFMEESGKYYDPAVRLWENESNNIIERITLINSYLNKLKGLKYPEQCKKYREILIKHLNLIKENFLLKQGGVSDKSDKNRNVIGRILKIEGEVYIESFRLLKDINLFDNFDSELKILKNNKERERF